MVQLELAARVPPERLMVPDPAVAVPPQLLVRPGVFATTSPAGRLSTNWRPVSAVLTFGFCIEKTSVVEPPSGMLAAPNAFAMVGAEMTTTLATEVLLVPPLVEVTVVLLLKLPNATPVTVTAKKHWVPGAMLAPVRLMPVGLVNVTVPPQIEALAFGTVRPAGSV